MEPKAKLAMVRASLEPGQSVSVMARNNDINAGQLFLQRKLYQYGGSVAVSADEAVVPASQLSDALKQIRELQRMQGKKAMEAEILKGSWRPQGGENGLRILPCGRGTTSEAVSEFLCVARSQLTVRIKQSVSPKV